jgi:predicted pyridoxine 5'-phosphate oxidase superfamily flavin-nucleotide-binding protein
MQLSAEMRRAVEQEQLGFVATVRPDGTPALSPKGTTSVWTDSQLVFLHIHSEGTVANLAVNPAIEINVVDPVARRGWRFRGHAAVHSSGPVFDEVLRHFTASGRASSAARAQAVVIMDVEAADLLLSPAYDDGTSQEQIAARWRPRWQARLDRLASRSDVEMSSQPEDRPADKRC